MQHLLSDKIASPPEYRAHFTEAFALVPVSFSLTSLAEFRGQTKHSLLLADFNKVFKIDPDIFEVPPSQLACCHLRLGALLCVA